MRVSAFAFVIALAATAQSAAVPNSHVVHEKREVTSSRWVKREKLAPSDILPMRIGLKQRNLDRGHEFLMDV
jgi:tripeptidyl-peptidase-1